MITKKDAEAVVLIATIGAIGFGMWMSSFGAWMFMWAVLVFAGAKTTYSGDK